MDNHTPLRSRLIAVLEHTYGYERRLAGELSEAERAAVGTLERWSPKDLIAHMTSWRKRLNERLDAALRDETPTNFGDTDELNAEAFEANRQRSWSDVVGEAETTFAQLVQYVEQFRDEDLADPNRYAWRKGDPLFLHVIGTAHLHPLTHITEFYRERNDWARAEEMHKANVSIVLDKLGEWPRMRGIALYDLACFYATAGRPDEALPLLREALPLHPRLVEWSKQDPDLDSLRDRPEYQALYAT
jgi:hypothetical protein